ncbi:unnamed protein product [Cyclocybe aegerita]|uniref:Hyaluronan-mediated motility receptor C-terminal domain-containing protein n=1 Tax=Cyclocybe aegerita TaxID=1973307 RepID=A0A8S0VQA4_CYCAE|nr:unnamed protein product [Cyclocybe aegerita]
MFPRGPRFEHLKASDVPPPGAYNIPQESMLDNYKHGAFLERADRFSKDKQPTAPAQKIKASPTQSLAEKYAALQKKVADLEKVHLDGKRAHNAELERLKQELALSQKQLSDQTDKFGKQKKQTATLEALVQDLKKNATIDQSELKDLRHKLRLLELDREKLSSKQPEIAQLRKFLQALEIKRKDDLKERDHRIADLERQLQAEKKKRDLLEHKTQDSKRLFDEERQALRAAMHDVEVHLTKTKAEASEAQDRLRHVQDEKTADEGELLEQLEQHRRLLDTVARQYATVVSQSMSLAAYKRLQHDYAALQIRQFRLERKLTNSEGQVVELTHLFRQVKEDNTHLSHLLRDALEEIAFLANLSESRPAEEQSATVDNVAQDVRDRAVELARVDAATESLTSRYYQLKSNELHFASTVLVKEHADAVTLAEQRASDLSSALASHEMIAARLETVQKDRADSEERLKQATEEAEHLKTSAAILESKLARLQEEFDGIASVHATALKKEKDTIQRLTSTIQKNRSAEEALRAEIEQLTAEITEAERFQEAYYSLSDQVGTLITRKQIAEEEADRISKFNAEILGHNNPAQRIMYVDRIRRELAEAKHKIAQLTREQENVVVENNELQNELDMYKSVRYLGDSKPRTNITRVARLPLVNVTQSLNGSIHNSKLNSGSYAKPAFEPLTEVADSDMTIDEIM